ncbi:hypothetical protein KFU94_36345 [Chloroflexi bacterium TSY]|nr:hypothetical protein [Chloroflexi bacterium TSY]
MAHILRVGFVVADSEDVIGDIQRILEVLAQKELLQQTEKARGPAA